MPAAELESKIVTLIQNIHLPLKDKISQLIDLFRVRSDAQATDLNPAIASFKMEDGGNILHYAANAGSYHLLWELSNNLFITPETFTTLLFQKNKDGKIPLAQAEQYVAINPQYKTCVDYLKRLMSAATTKNLLRELNMVLLGKGTPLPKPTFSDAPAAAQSTQNQKAPPPIPKARRVAPPSKIPDRVKRKLFSELDQGRQQPAAPDQAKKPKR